jgi:cytochrome c-type biogenesis protein CcmH/NrfG
VSAEPDEDPEIAARIELLRGLAEADPGDASTHFLLGRELLTHGRSGEAADAFRSALKADPDYTAAYRQLGNALEQCDRHTEAAAIYRAGVEVAGRTHDLQAGKEMQAFLKRLARDHGLRD